MSLPVPVPSFPVPQSDLTSHPNALRTPATTSFYLPATLLIYKRVILLHMILTWIIVHEAIHHAVVISVGTPRGSDKRGGASN